MVLNNTESITDHVLPSACARQKLLQIHSEHSQLTHFQ